VTPGHSLIIAIDGPSASGKGTLARRLAERFGLAHLDTGALYRVTGFLVLMRGGDPADPVVAEWAAKEVPAALIRDPTLVLGPRIRTEAVGGAASVVAAIPAVRAALLAFQRSFARHPPPPAKGAVLDGRDIGTVVCPDANMKLFITASVESRAFRRVKELRERGAAAIYDDVLQDLRERDARDSERQVAPLAAAPDAITIDTTLLEADQVFEQASKLIARYCALRS
jgi:CMP/dCMP kinase